MIVQATGRVRIKATAALMTQEPKDTRQIGVDNTVIDSMRAVVGRVKIKAAAERIN